MNERHAEIFEKAGGPLTKRIAPRNGKIANDSSACRVANASAHRVRIELDNFGALAAIHVVAARDGDAAR
jgi:hypothetical protein